MRTDKNLQSAFEIFITGDGVQRVKLELIHEGHIVETEFICSLHRLGFAPTTVAAVNVHPGERVPAFYVKDSMAYFGWVFWEKFTDKKLRKLWGSVARNKKGDWAIQLPPNKQALIYANPALKSHMDIDHPV
jgi:hypothetical protein